MNYVASRGSAHFDTASYREKGISARSRRSRTVSLALFFARIVDTDIVASSYLMSYPYILSATLHSYAGLLCFYLSQPVATRQFQHRPINTTHPSQAYPDSDTDDNASTGSDDSATTHQPKDGRFTADSLGLNERLLRNASAHFSKALAREKETQGVDVLQDDERIAESGIERDLKIKLRMAHGTAKVSQMFIDEVGCFVVLFCYALTRRFTVCHW